MAIESIFLTEGIIPGHTERTHEYYDSQYYSGRKTGNGVQFPKDGSYLNPESEYRFKFQDLLKWMGEYIRNGNILDIGCGPGHLAYWSKKLQKPFNIVEGDHSTASLGLSHQNLVICSAYQLPFASEIFDGILVSDVLEHLSPEHTLLTVREAHRLLRHEGRIFVNIPNRITWSRAAYKDQGHVWLPSLKEVRDLLQIGGFNNEFISTFTRGFPLSQMIRRVTKRDIRFPCFGRSIFATVQKS